MYWTFERIARGGVGGGQFPGVARVQLFHRGRALKGVGVRGDGGARLARGVAQGGGLGDRSARALVQERGDGQGAGGVVHRLGDGLSPLHVVKGNHGRHGMYSRWNLV